MHPLSPLAHGSFTRLLMGWPTRLGSREVGRREELRGKVGRREELRGKVGEEGG